MRVRSGLIAVFAAGAAMSAGCARQLAPTPTVYWDEESNPLAATPAPLRTTTAEVVYVTDRARNDRGDRVWYGSGRSKSMAWGVATVRFGDERLTWAELEDASDGRSRRVSVPLRVVAVEERDRLPEADTWGGEVVDGVWRENADDQARRREVTRAFEAEIDRRLQEAGSGDVFVYIHGIRNAFDDPILVAAELWHFLGRDAVPIVYTWPSSHRADLLRGYSHDRESGEFTVYHLKAMLKALGAMPAVERVHLLAHSRGTEVLCDALRELNAQYRGAGVRTRDRLKLADVILAAPDIDVQVASQRLGAERLHLVPERFTIYACREDGALAVARWLMMRNNSLGLTSVHDLSAQQRAAAGRFPEMQIVDVTARVPGLGHGYFYQHPAVLSDLVRLLEGNDAGSPERPLRKLDAPFWELPDRYLDPNSLAGDD